MKKIIIIAALLCTAVPGVRAQGNIEEVLRQVEQYSKELQSRSELTEAQQLEAKTDKYLSNPSVEYEHMWGNTSPAVSQGELTVSQGFDFPSAYGNRNKISKLRSAQYTHEQEAFRQELLLGAKRLCIEIIYLRKQKELLGMQLENAQRMAVAYQRKFDSGDANVLEYNKTVVELVNARTAAELNEATLKARLEQLSNMAGGNPVTFTATDFPATAQLPDFSLLLDSYLGNAPAIRGMERELEISRTNVSLNRALSLPKFEVGYRLDFGEGHRFNGIQAGMSIPLFENKNKVKTAKAQTLWADTRLQSEKLNRTSELRRFYDQAQTLRQSMEQLSETIDTHNSIALLGKALDAGQLSVINYYTEVSGIYASYQTLLDIQMQYHDLIAQIYRFAL